MQSMSSSSNAATFRIRFGKGIPRPMPPCLQDIWTCNEWQDFCGDYDKIVVEGYRQVRVAYALVIAGVLLGVLLGLLAARMAGLFMGCTIVFFSVMVTLVYVSWMQRLTISRLDELCKASSVKHGKLIQFQVDQDYTRIIDPSGGADRGQVASFTIREHYLKIRHTTNKGDSVPAVPTAISCDSNLSRTRSIFREVEVVTDKHRELGERLQALDQLRDVMSTDEYDGKRQEIMDSV